MSDTKLDPATLSAEERVELDHWQSHPLFVALYANEMNDSSGTVESASKELGIDPSLYLGRKHWPILALRHVLETMRALFAPATEKAECPNCGQPTEESPDRPLFNDHLCQYPCPPAQPEPAAPEKVVCPNCLRETETTFQHEIRLPAGYSPEYACQPEQPEPAAPEMPEAVKNALGRLAYCASSPHETDRWMEETLKIRTALESWWRTHSQPVAVWMTEELLNVTERTLNKLDRTWDQFFAPVRAAIAAVRQQAAQGTPKVELPKVREAINAMGRMAYGEPFAQSILKRLENAALAELDTAEGRK